MPAAPRRNSEGTGRSGTGRSSVPTTVDTERGSQLQGLELTREQKLQLYRDVRPAAAVLSRGAVLRARSRSRSRAVRRVLSSSKAWYQGS